MPQHRFDDHGHCCPDDGQQEVYDGPTFHSVSEWDRMSEQIAALKHQVACTEACANEHISAYKKRMQPRMDDAERFVALAIAYVTHDPKFAALCDNTTLRPSTVDEVRSAIDCAMRGRRG